MVLPSIAVHPLPLELCLAVQGETDAASHDEFEPEQDVWRSKRKPCALVHANGIVDVRTSLGSYLPTLGQRVLAAGARSGQRVREN